MMWENEHTCFDITTALTDTCECQRVHVAGEKCHRVIIEVYTKHYRQAVRGKSSHSFDDMAGWSMPTELHAGVKYLQADAIEFQLQA